MNQFLTIALLFFALPIYGQAFKEAWAPLVEASCIDCHDANTDTPLNLEKIGHDLSDPNTFRQWVKIFDQVDSGEMPPKKKKRPDRVIKNKALATLHKHLRDASLAKLIKEGRAPVRRLTRTEYEYTLHDLLGISGDLASKLPPESTTSTFDTIAADQGISTVHIRSYLAAADQAIDETIELRPRPDHKPRLIDYPNHPYSRCGLKGSCDAAAIL